MKKFVVMLAGLMAAGAVSAAPLTPAEALARVQGNGANRVVARNYAPTPVYTVKTEANMAAAYVFAADGDHGYTILSADDVAYPVLGYSDNGSFDVNNIPVNMQWWLSEYARQIEWARSQGASVASAPAAPEEWSAITPLVKTTWDQGEPYNNSCPTYRNQGTQHAYTGCVATSMAQVMNYFKYPEHGEGYIEYYISKLGVRVAKQLSSIVFDWDNMLDNYAAGSYTDAQAKAVADLMVACGYSVNMGYGLDASGASGNTIGASLRNYFKYDSNCHSEFRMLYSMSEWTEKIYNNLKYVGPVIVNGRDPGEVGHSFVCDGYDGKGYFHFNWGWSGMSDGYYSLDALNPDAMGIGGYGGGFNFGQNAIFGIQPPKTEPNEYKLNLVQLGNTTASVQGSSIVLGTADYTSGGYGNYCDETVNGVFGLSFQKVGSDAQPEIVTVKLGMATEVSLEPGYSYNSTNQLIGVLPELENGKYKVTVMFKPEGAGWDEIQVIWGYNNYVYLDKDASGITVTKPEQNALKILSAEVASNFYYNTPVLIKLKVQNSSDIELSQGVIPHLYDGAKDAMKGSNALITVGPNETVDIDLVANFSALNGYTFNSPTDFVLNIMNPETNESYGNFGTYTMEKGSSAFSLTLKKLEVSGSELSTVEYAGVTRSAYTVKDPSEFDVNFNYSVRTGYFAGFVKLGIYMVDPEKVSNLIPVTSVDQIFQQTAFMEKGDLSENVVPVNFPDAEAGVLYAIVAQYNKSQSWANLGSAAYFVTGVTGVGDILVDAEESEVEYYNLQGMKVAEPKSGEILIRRSGDKTEKVVIR